MPVAPFLFGVLAGGGAVFVVDKTLEGVSDIAKWAVIGGALYVGAKHLKAI